MPGTLKNEDHMGIGDHKYDNNGSVKSESGFDAWVGEISGAVPEKTLNRPEKKEVYDA
ncbi:MAG: hypothetical protein GY846_02235 [Deltaproteobacteria bacterium]|nr:hypothetical protein [Deltaproteobacteria bacterium]